MRPYTFLTFASVIWISPSRLRNFNGNAVIFLRPAGRTLAEVYIRLGAAGFPNGFAPTLFMAATGTIGMRPFTNRLTPLL